MNQQAPAGERSRASYGGAGAGAADRRRAGAAHLPRWGTLLIHLIAPVTFLIAALVLPAFMLARPFRGPGLGPGAWPQLMLVLVAACSLIWAAQTVLRWRRGRLEAAAVAASDAGESYSYAKALVGLVLILAYGWSLPWVGFPITTTVFIAVWCILGGVRNPFAVVPISVIGTIALLWVFMGLALMPLSRGRGVFDSISIAVLRALGIY